MAVELRLIRYALELGRHRNFSRAAEALQVTQPSLTRAVAALERSLGLRLFDRTRKGVIPTAFGCLLLERGEAILKSEAALQRELQLLAGVEEGTLEIGAGPYATEISVAEAVARLAAAHPGLRISCLTASPDEIFRDVLAERVDVGVVAAVGSDNSTRLVVELLTPHRLSFACRPGHPLTAIHRPPFRELLEYSMATVALTREQVAALFSPPLDGAQNAEISDHVPRILVSSLSIARMIARRSDTLVAGTKGQLADDVARGQLVVIDYEGPPIQTVHGIVHLAERTLSPAACAFIGTLKAVEAEVQLADPLPSADDAGSPNRQRAAKTAAGRSRRQRSG